MPQFSVTIFYRFLWAGGLATGLHWLVMWWLVQGDIDATLATAIGAVCGAAVNYLLQYFHSFRCAESHFKVFPAYVRACALGWIANASLFYLISHFVLPGLSWAQLCTTGLVTLLNFYLYKKVVFHERSCI